MQKKIIALAIAAAFAAPVAAFAAADGTTFYGSMDGGIRHQSNEGAAGTTDSMQMGQYNTARWGFKSVEDMGDGLKANLVLETSIAPQSVGTPGVSASNGNGIIFDRQAVIGLSNAMGSFDMGWNYTGPFVAATSVDPMGGKFLSNVFGGSTTYVTASLPAVRANSMTVAVPVGSDLKIVGQYLMNNAGATSAPTTGAGRGIVALYAAGDVNVTVAYAAIESSVGSDSPITNVVAGAGYNYGMGKVSVGYVKNAQKTTASDSTNTSMWLGGTYNISTATQATLAYYKNTTNNGAATGVDVNKNKLMAMVTYALSKRTSLYVEADTETKAAAYADGSDQKTSGSGVGLSTTF